VACDIHPLGNLRVLNYLSSSLDVQEAAKLGWSQHWITEGFAALEALLSSSANTGSLCHGDTPTIADCCLVPQVFNARRFGVNLTPYPTIVAIDAACATIPAFIDAHPARQPDTA
jgi:maleylpyruvate isomerase